MVTTSAGSPAAAVESQAHLIGTGAVAEAEARLRQQLGMRQAMCVSNATLGLLACAMALDLRRREVIVPALVHGASIAGLLHLGAKLRIVDVDPETLTIDVDAARRALTSRTAAVLGVDLFGIPSDTRGLRQLADDAGVWYIADAAQGFGASRSDRPASAEADAVALSFTAGKVLDAGEGGAILTNRRDVYDRLVWLTQHPYRQRRDLGLHLTNAFALNVRIHPASAAIVAADMEAALRALDAHRCRVRRAAAVLHQIGAGRCVAVFATQRMNPTYFRLPVRLQAGWSAARLCEVLRAEGLDCAPDPEPPMPVHKHPVFSAVHRRQASVPRRCVVAEAAAREVVALRVLPATTRQACPSQCRKVALPRQ